MERNESFEGSLGSLPVSQLPVTARRAELLLNGLKTLEYVLRSLGHPLPEDIAPLEQDLQQKIRILTLPRSDCLTIEQVADELDLSPRYVLDLGKKGHITPVHQGKRQRGDASVYTAESVREFQEKRRHGKKNQGARPRSDDPAEGESEG